MSVGNFIVDSSLFESWFDGKYTYLGISKSTKNKLQYGHEEQKVLIVVIHVKAYWQYILEDS